MLNKLQIRSTVADISQLNLVNEKSLLKNRVKMVLAMSAVTSSIRST